MAAPIILNVVKVENGWIVCVNTDLAECRRGKRFVFNTPDELGRAVTDLVQTGELPPEPSV